MEDSEPVGRTSKIWRFVGNRLLRISLLFLILTVPVCCVAVRLTGSSPPAKLAADPEMLKQEVKALTEDFGARYYQNAETMKSVRAYIRERFEAAGAVVEEQGYVSQGSSQNNVRAFIGDKSKPRIVVGAHYDSCVCYETGTNPGADDNASGVAGLFGLARLLAKERPTDVCVELVAYSTEEPPFFGSDDMGSYRHAELLAHERVQVKGVLILEMIGYFTDEPGSQDYPTALFKLIYPSTGNFVAIVGGIGDRGLIATTKKAMQGSAPVDVTSSCIPRNMDFVHLSDHRNYWEFDYDAVMITDTSFYRNPNYHKKTDTWDTLDYKRMAHVVTQVHQAVMALGEKQ